MKRNLKGQFIKRTNGNVFEGFGVWYDQKGYPSIRIDGKTIKIHVLVWERVNGKKPKGFVIHHKDLYRKNFDLTNLELLSDSDHKRLHAGWVRKDGQWVAKLCSGCGEVLILDSFYPRKGYTPSALCKRCHNKDVNIRRSTPEAKAKMKVYKHNYYEKNRLRLREKQRISYARRKEVMAL